MVQRMLNISDEDWLSRALMGLADAPILENFRLSERGILYNKAVEPMKMEMNAR